MSKLKKYLEETKKVKQCDNCKGGEVRYEPSAKFNPKTGNVDKEHKPYTCNKCKKSFTKEEFLKLKD